ncbi:uncharacterized protein MYCGRDRAFT_68166 [Zymoseptoria tritici IPO323]|uniref:Uncharacterized protein n=1 Tax=Zymoseptoria tritici (strain CBS 115943 / IPO323) TaxID=336722 RepID=F9X4A6_ZYMTI|nr:uncharacterized protein MYCGRDRAFT_68166 [Zymoseptoria tritici IPO323]EGP89863.1 hypothetical protein MYCGRDRAFT_68166 [Zymoseptoria tritici IPO323]
MALERGARPLARCLRCTRHEKITTLPIRAFTLSAPKCLETETAAGSSEPPPPPPSSKSERLKLDPFKVSTPRQEKRLLRTQHLLPVGSRRRRAAMKSTSQIPFEEIPYQCFQEARKVLQEDRAVRMEEIRTQRERIEFLKEKVVVGEEEEMKKATTLRDMQQRLEKTKIWADINDPLVKKKFEDGLGDMTKPIYRYLADRKWRTYERPLLVQRITQMNIIPDLLPGLAPTVATSLAFPLPTLPHKRKNIPHGDVVEARISESPAILSIQPFTAGEQLVTIAVVNPDVPDVESDGYTSRCHFLACNVPISAVNTQVKLASLDKSSQVVHSWLPAFAQKGLDKQRMAIVVLAQRQAADGSSTTIDTAAVKSVDQGRFGKRNHFSLRSFLPKFGLSPIGVDLFRTTWDASTAEVMRRAGVQGWNLEFKRKRVEPLPYQRLKEERYR